MAFDSKKEIKTGCGSASTTKPVNPFCLLSSVRGAILSGSLTSGCLFFVEATDCFCYKHKAVLRLWIYF